MKNKKVGLRKLMIVFMVGYLLVLGCLAMLWSPVGDLFPTGLFILWPMAGVRSAMRTFSISAWMQVLGWVVFFVPLGILMPAGIKKTRSFGWFFLWNLVISAGMVWVGFFVRGESFVTDKVLGHALGGLIGYGFFRILLRRQALHNRRRLSEEIEKRSSYKESRESQNLMEEMIQKTKCLPVLLYQIPLCALLIFLAVIFTRYEQQSYGNLDCMYASRVQLADTKIIVRNEFSGERKNCPIYQAKVYDTKAARERARNLMAGVGYELGAEETAEEGEVCYKSADGRVELWIELVGGKYMLTDYSRWSEEHSGLSGADEKKVKKALAKWKIQIPEGGSFREVGGGTYAFDYESQTGDGGFLDGVLACDIDNDGKVTRVNWQLPEGTECGRKDILSQKEAYDRIISGKFEVAGYESGRGIQILEIRKFRSGYALDSKGFYQPIYHAELMINGEEAETDLPAIP